MGKNNLCVLFPGVGYTAERPLMYYAGKVLKNKGYEIISLKYEGLPKKKGNDVSKMGETFDMVMEQTGKQLKDVRFDEYDSVVFVGKSIGTIAMVRYASQASLDNLKLVYITPLAQTFMDTVKAPAIAFHGTSDPWVGTDIIEAECERLGVPLYKYKDSNHSLETGDVKTDIESVGDVMMKIENFID